MAETEVIITQDRFGRDVTIPIDENGNIILYRATDDPSRIIDSDFRPLAKDKGSVGLGQQSYFSPNPMYSHKYQSSGRKNYKFVTQIKPNEILPTDMFVKNYPELVSALNIPEEYTNQNWRQLVNDDKAMIAMGYETGGKRFFNDNIQTFIDNGIKAFGSGSTGTGGQTYIEYEIIPLVKEGDTLGIKPVATLQTKEGFAAGKSPEAFIETSLDTPTNVAGAEVIDEAVDITESSGSIVDEIESIQSETLEKLRNSNDAFVAEQVDDIMARKINEVLPFVDTSLSRAEAIGISTTGPQITTSADPTLNAFIDDIEKITGQTLDITEKRKLRQFLYDVAKGNDNLLFEKKSFIPDLQDGINSAKLNDPGYKIWKNWQHSGAFRPQTILDMTVNEYEAFGKPPWVNLVEGLDKSGEVIDFRAISDVGLDIPEGIDTPTNVVDDVVVTSASENLKQTIPTNADGNIVLYRATTNPNANILSDFTDINMSNQAGLGQQSFYAIDEMYAYNYSRPSINKNVYKYETNIKPNQVLNIQSPTNAQLDVLEKINITAQDLENWDMFNTGEVNKKIQNNLDYLLENNIKAIGNNKVGGSPGVFDYEIVPIITEKTQTEIKPVSQLILDPNWEGTDRILNVENELFQSTQSTQWADKYLPIDVNDPNTKYRPVYYIDEEGIGRKAKDFQFSEQPIENNLVKDNLIEVPVNTKTNVNLVNDTYVINTDLPGPSLGAAQLNDPLVFDSWIDNLGKTTTSFVDNLPLETIVKNRVKNLIAKKSAQAATPGGFMDAVDAWEFAVLGLMAAAVAFKEYDEIPTIITNKAVDMFNSMTSFYGIPPVQKKEYDLDYKYITKVLDTGEKFMPTDIIIKKGVEEFKEGQESGVDISAGLGAQAGVFNNSITTPAKTDTMETTQKIQPGVQEEKMFKKAKPQKGTGAGSGVKIL